MTHLVYDGSFEGLLTAVFESYEYRLKDYEILTVAAAAQKSLFAETHPVCTSAEKAARVLKKFETLTSRQGVGTLLRVYLFENDHRERLIAYAIGRALAHPKQDIFDDLAQPEILEVAKILKSMAREVHRMHAFVRFELLEDEVYFAKIEPDYNVLPLIVSHFKQRYADQKWMIYDVARGYAAVYDGQAVEFFHPTPEQEQQMQQNQAFWHASEVKYQTLWQRYFIKTGIPARRNMKLHLQHVPRRYWKYLTEKT